MQSVKELAFDASLDLPFEDVIDKVKAALAEEGFGVLTEIDVQDTFKKKLGENFTKYVILGACNPPSAYRLLKAELNAGLLLPCNVIVYQTNDQRTCVVAINPISALKIMDSQELTDSQELHEVAEEVSQRLRKVIVAIGPHD